MEANPIPSAQNSQENLIRLAAQRQMYRAAKTYLAISMIIAGPAAVAVAAVVAYFPDEKIWALLFGIASIALDMAVLSQRQRRLQDLAARTQEAFDCSVLDLKWQDLKGSYPDAELVHRYAERFRKTDPQLVSVVNWYPSQVGSVPLPYARLICQRENSRWDLELRQRYTWWLRVGLAMTGLAVLLAGHFWALTVDKTVQGVVGPLLPALSLTWRLIREHAAASVVATRLKLHAEALWKKALRGELKSDELTEASRDLQSEIFEYRRANPLVFDWMYRRLRDPYEDEASFSADTMVDEVLRNLAEHRV